MSLRELLADLIGAEVQEQPVTINGKTKNLNFRQITDAEGRKIFAPSAEGESADDRGLRVMVQLIAASLCDRDGNQITNEAEVRALPYGSQAGLVQGAYITNNMISKSAPGEAEDVGAEVSDSEKKA